FARRSASATAPTSSTRERCSPPAIRRRLSIMTACAGSIWAKTSACSLPRHTADLMKPSLQFRLSQHLTLTPQLQQSIRLLQLSTVELNQEIDRLLMENPALEREDVDEAGDAAAVAAGPGSSTSAPTEEAPAAPEADWSVETAATWRGASDEDEERSFATPDTPT